MMDMRLLNWKPVLIVALSPNKINMKHPMKINYIKISTTLFTVTIVVFALVSFRGQQKEPWTRDQLLAPDALAKTINDPQLHQPIVLCVGPAATIKNSIEIGATREKENLDKLKEHVKGLSKNESIVLYCGCCPFDKCP